MHVTGGEHDIEKTPVVPVSGGTAPFTLEAVSFISLYPSPVERSVR